MGAGILPCIWRGCLCPSCTHAWQQQQAIDDAGKPCLHQVLDLYNLVAAQLLVGFPFRD
jgi:hypothetical protein